MKLYHYTLRKHLPSILELGLIPGYKPGAYGSPQDDRGVWLDTGKFRIETPGWVLLGIDVSQLNLTKLVYPRYNLQGRWFLYQDTIPREAITVIDSKE